MYNWNWESRAILQSCWTRERFQQCKTKTGIKVHYILQMKTPRPEKGSAPKQFGCASLQRTGSPSQLVSSQAWVPIVEKTDQGQVKDLRAPKGNHGPKHDIQLVVGKLYEQWRAWRDLKEQVPSSSLSSHDLPEMCLGQDSTLPVCTCLPSTTASFHIRNRKPQSLPLTYREHRARELHQGGLRMSRSLCYEKLSTWVSCRCMLKLGNKRAGLRKNRNKISRACTNRNLFFAYATCVGRASYGRLEAIFILYQSETERCPSGTSVNCQRRKKEWRKPGCCL